MTVNEEFPRLFVTRRQSRDGAKYYGPYADAGAMHATVKLLRSLPLRTKKICTHAPVISRREA